MTDQRSILHRLMDVIEARRNSPPERSYTVTLFAGGVGKIGAKIVEEAAEVVDAAESAHLGGDSRGHLTHEAADLIYHLFVMLAQCQIPLAEVEAELARRFGVSGLDEKDARIP